MAKSNVANSTLTTDFNVSPYYDDYDAVKEYYRILYKPGFAVQSRELTQMQTMLQNQIKRFGVNIFKEGSIVVPGQFTFRVNVDGKKGAPVDYVKIKTNNSSNNTVDVTSFLDQIITGSTSKIRAKVTNVLDTDGTTANTKTLYVTYLGASPLNSATKKFSANETLINKEVGTCIVGDANNSPIGYSSLFKIDEGVIFAKDHFVYFPTQEVILDRYNPLPTCKVGFFLTEEIIDASEDSSLLDPALESSNYAAPGADRLKISAKLSVVDYNFQESNDFVTLFTMQDGVLQLSNEKSQYNILGDAMAARTYDESGDYVIRGYNVQINEHDRVTYPVPNNGRYENGNNQNLVVSVDAGHGYVKGYSVTNYDRTDITIPKAVAYQNVDQQILSATMGSYVVVNELVGTWTADKGTTVSIYNAPNKRISAEGMGSIGVPQGTLIGQATFNAIEYVTGTPGYDAKYNVYLADVQIESGYSFTEARSLYFDNATTADAGADIVVPPTGVSLINVSNSPLLYRVGAGSIRSVTNPDGTPSVDYSYKKTDSSIYIPPSGLLSVNLTGPSNEILPYGTTTLNGVKATSDFMLTCEESFNIGPLWTATFATVVGEGFSLLGAGTYFTRLNVGDKIKLSGIDTTFHIASILGDNELTVTTPFPDTEGNPWITGNTIFKAYDTGDNINLAGVGLDAGQKRTVSVTPTSVTIDLKETLPDDVDVSLSYPLYVTNSSPAAKVLNPGRIVKIDCSTAGVTGPFYLGFSDVYGIRKIIRKTGSAPDSLTDGVDVTKYFLLNNGQKDTHYDIGYITKSGSLSLLSNDHLMVELDYFTPSYAGKGGFFTVDSYPVQDDDSLSTSTTIRTENIPVHISGTDAYDLRNYIDFRPVKTNTAVNTTNPDEASTNPASTSWTYQNSTTGLKFPVPSSSITFNYSYYLGRRDLVVVTKDNTIAVIRGIPSINPVVPTALETQMVIAILDIAPYPSLSPYFANKLSRRDLSCLVTKTLTRGWTMKDIGQLDSRIKNLEYYAALTLLEKEAVNLKILDDNGNERFKNGIFVDTFRDTALSAKTTNPDFRIVVDPQELSIRPLFGTESIPYKDYQLTNLINKNNLLMFPYTENEIFTQDRVTDFRNLERGTYLFQGVLSLTPEEDVWIDTTQLPDETISLSATGATLSVTNIVGDRLQFNDANCPAILIGTDTGANLLFSSSNNNSYFANSNIIAVGPGQVGSPNTKKNAVVQTNYIARGRSTNAKAIILGATYLNNTLNGITINPPFDLDFIENEYIDVWKTTKFTQPGTQYTGISFRIEKINKNYVSKIFLNDEVYGTASTANGSISQINFDKSTGTLYSVEIDYINGKSFNNGELIDFYYGSNSNYTGISSYISTVENSYFRTITPGDVVINQSNNKGIVVSTEYDGANLTAVSVSTNTNFNVDDKIDFLRANNYYTGISANVDAVSSAVAPSEDTSEKITKNLTNTVWEGWRANITGYRIYKGSGSNKTPVGGIYATETAARKAASAWTSKWKKGVATLETIYENNRIGTNYFASISSDGAVGPNKLISSETIPYIRPQVLTIRGDGLKPFSKMNVWFDGVDVTSYCTPLTESQYIQGIGGETITPDPDNYTVTTEVNVTPETTTEVVTTIITPDPATNMANSTCPIIVRDTGSTFFRFQISNADGAPKFRTGTRRIYIMDNAQSNINNIQDEQDATTSAVGTFYADGTRQTLQRTVYSTRGFETTSEETSEQYQSTTQVVLPNTGRPPLPPKGHCCFDPDAKVLMADFTWKRIEDVVVGDRVIGDGGVVNTVLKNKATFVSDRKMLQLKGSSFWTTDDHLFLTDNGWKTWDPQHVINDPHTTNGEFLIGKNREESINHNDAMKMVDIVDGKIVDKFVPYKNIEAVEGDFDPNFVVHDLTLDGNMTYVVEGFVVHNCCFAYSVLISAPDSEEGIFCPGFDVFVARKSTTRKMWFEVREVDSSGGISNSQVPGTVVYIENKDIPVSTNGIDNPLEVRFPAPVFLMNNKQYAFVVHSFSPYYMNVDPDTYMWISRIGEIDKNTGTPVNDRMRLGTFFQTTNNRQWEAIQDVDLTIKIYRAVFTPGTATAIIGNSPLEKMTLGSVSSSFQELIGDTVSSGDVLSLINANGSFSVGNIIIGKTSGVRGTVISIPENGKIAVSNTYYQTGEGIDAYSNDGTTYLKVSGTIQSVANSTAVLSYYKEAANKVYAEFKKSSGGFKVGDKLISTTSGPKYSFTVQSIDNFPYSMSSFEPRVLDFLKTDFKYEMATVANNSTSLGEWNLIHETETYYWPEEKVIFSRSDELNLLEGIPSQQVKVTMTTESEYVTPVFDLNTTHSVIIENIVNNDASGEDGKSGGNAINKYISQTITLADGQDAEDLKVYITAYRPPGTDVKVYAKISNAADPDTLEQKNWIEMQKDGTGEYNYSSVVDRLNFREYSYIFSNDMMSGEMGQVQYTSAGTTYTGFKYFAVKIVLLANDPAVVPRVADLRAMALQI